MQPPSAETVDHVVCASIASSGESVFSQMESIRAASMRRNTPVGLNAVLLHVSGWFVQWLEGPGEAVRQTLKRVALDRRHQGPRILHYSHGPRMLDAPWNMMMVPSPSSQQDMAERVAHLRQTWQEGRQFPPTSVLRRLVTPFLLAHDGDRGDPEAFHRIGVCAADSGSAFALARAVADRYEQPLQHRRVAGVDGHDAGLETVDLLYEGQACRLNALPWQSLLQGLLRAFLPDWHLLVLILSGIPHHDDALMQRVCKLMEGLPMGPRVLGVAPDAETHVRMMTAADQAGLRYEHLAIVAPSDVATIWLAIAGQMRAMGRPVISSWPVPGDAPLETAG